MSTLRASHGVSVEPVGAVLQLGPLSLHTDGSAVTTDANGRHVLSLPFRRASFLQTCGYRTWDMLGALGVPVFTGWTRVAGNGFDYGCWVDLDDEAAFVLARLARQDSICTWDADAVCFTSLHGDGLATEIALASPVVRFVHPLEVPGGVASSASDPVGRRSCAVVY